MQKRAFIQSTIFEKHFAMSLRNTLFKITSVVQASLMLLFVRIINVNTSSIHLILLILAPINIMIVSGTVVVDTKALSDVVHELTFVLATDSLRNFKPFLAFLLNSFFIVVDVFSPIAIRHQL
jgi:hypothetical protein